MFGTNKSFTERLSVIESTYQKVLEDARQLASDIQEGINEKEAQLSILKANLEETIYLITKLSQFE